MSKEKSPFFVNSDKSSYQNDPNFIDVDKILAEKFQKEQAAKLQQEKQISEHTEHQAKGKNVW